MNFFPMTAATNSPLLRLVLLLTGVTGAVQARDKIGADLPWTTYEAEAMHTTGTVLGPQYAPYLLETESSGQKCVKLAAAGEYVEFAAVAEANALVIRYSLPDSRDGGGTQASLVLS